MKELIGQTLSICNNTPDKLSMLANISACLNEGMKDINWVGFYLFKDNQLHLGPFQGRVACTLIDIGKGVCGTSFEKKMLLNIRDVHNFEGHIACDSRTNSEIVVPLIYGSKRFGVLDIDSISYNRFDLEDEAVLEEIAKIISKYLAK